MKSPLPENDILNLITETFGKSKIPMFWCGPNSFLLFNKAFETASGYSEKELFEIGFDELSHQENPFDGLSNIHSAKEPREAKVLGWLVKKKDGTKDMFELRITKLGRDRKKEESTFFGVMRPLEKFEDKNEIFTDTAKRLEDSLAASKQGIWQWLATMRHHTLINSHIGLVDNEKHEISFDEKSFIKRVHPKDRARVQLTWNHFLKNDDDYYQDEYRICNKDEKYIWVNAKGKVMERKEDGTPLRVAGTINDINEEKENQETIRVQTQKLVDYAFMNSHLLRGPVTSIIGLVDLLFEENTDENLQKLKEVSEQLDKTIHDINDMVSETGQNLQLPSAQISNISLISKDSLKSLILKTTLEQLHANIDLNVNTNTQDYLLAMPHAQQSDLVILDEDSCDDIPEYLTEYEKKYSETPVYILASKFHLEMIAQLNQFDSVKGIILKSTDHSGILRFIENLSQ